LSKSGGIRWARHVEHVGEKRNAYKVLVGKPERKNPLVRTRHRVEGNIDPLKTKRICFI
jgi:hypothetical protein